MGEDAVMSLCRSAYSIAFLITWLMASISIGNDRARNVVFVLVDDLGWSDVSYNGSSVYETPNVDRLAREGMVFTNFYSAGPVCSPTRASILTGKYPARLGLTKWLYTPEKDPPFVAHHLPLEEFTIAEALREAGYATGYFGKWHLGYKLEHWAGRQGFEVAKGGADSPHAWKLAWPDRALPLPENHTRFFSPHHMTHLENGPEGEYLTDRLTDETINFIRHHRDRPFFAFLSFHTVHTPLQAKPGVVEKYRAKITSLGFDKRMEKNRLEKQYQNNADYAAMIHHMDENVGRLMQAIKRLGLDKETVVIFTSDNGGKGSVTSNLPLRGMKHNLYEGGIRVPTIVKWAGKVEAGSTCSFPLISNDFYPTILDLLNVPLRPEQHVDGVSIKDILLGQRARLDRMALFWHYPHSRVEGAVRMGNFKLIHSFKDDKVELYDLSKDIGERNNLSGEMPDRAAQMRASLVEWNKQVNARIPADIR
jgi:arylsulfatase A-like enzyme